MKQSYQFFKETIQVHTNEFKLYVFYSKTLLRFLNKLKSKFQILISCTISICEKYQQVTIKQILKEPRSIILTSKQINDMMIELMGHFEEIVSSTNICVQTTLKMLTEEYNLVSNIQILKNLNEPIKGNLQDLMIKIQNFQCYLKILLGRSSRISDQNQFHVFLQIQRLIQKIQQVIEQLCVNIKKKLLAENISYQNVENGVQTSDKNNDILVYVYKVKVSLTLKNHNSEFLNSLQLLLTTSNSLFSIILQMSNLVQLQGCKSQQKQVCQLINQKNIKALDILKIINQYGTKQSPGIPYNQALQNQASIQELIKKDRSQNEQINSLRIALKDAEAQIEDNSQQIQSNDQDKIEDSLQLSVVQNILDNAKYSIQEMLKQKGIELSENDLKHFELKSHQDQNIDIQNEIFTQSFSLTENIEKGIQQVALKLVNQKGKISLSDLISQDIIQGDEKFQKLFENAKQKIIKLSIQNQFLDEKYKQTLQKIKNQTKQQNEINSNQQQNDEQYQLLEAKLLKTQTDLEQTKQAYEIQIKMLSEYSAQLQDEIIQIKKK